MYELLKTIGDPSDLRKLDESQLRQFADELRRELVDAVSVTGGHLGAGLGVVELTVAIHHVFNTPRDKLIWDVGHQAYPHKILTGRRDRIRTLRMGGGLSGFTRRSESEYDPFGAAHSSTSISAGLGMAVGRDLKGEKRKPPKAASVVRISSWSPRKVRMISDTMLSEPLPAITFATLVPYSSASFSRRSRPLLG